MGIEGIDGTDAPAPGGSWEVVVVVILRDGAAWADAGGGE